ncbi:MAG TPA: 50S ribosomal protein L4 [Leptospiraceae bacterium]|nr:50S ribosomal protein L4 [Leptospiraceae bacterium]HMX32971.1 50S ribosomal protein L4 [Leptospiraceae bacterium]HMY33932.1 50S ribosomal protein L4 [Leptospiraceae bacterium]HMZ65709.1 50S ribosomal protein L4 [Leptospiraceae bacterium]HNA09304.1 50S ribosomal protein L4 [Leptospiraceae bacterium]
MKARKYSKTGQSLAEVELPGEIFTSKVSSGAIYDAIKAENANLRSGNHATKDRGEVRGGGKKPWSQKGTGRARQGSSRAPHWVGGGTVHGPKPRDYSIPLSRNVKRVAVVSILNKKASESKINILEDIAMTKYSTKEIFNIFKTMGVTNGAFSLVVSGEDKFLKASTKNIPTLKYVNAKRIVCRDILYNNQLIITESALKEIVSQYKDVSK